MRFIVPNALSLLRILLAPLLLYVDSCWRLPILGITVLSDFLDGYLARRWQAVSFFGTIIDPVGDKCVAAVLGYLYWNEGLLLVRDLWVIFSRDIVILLFTGILFVSGRWSAWKIQSFLCGKMATALQDLIFCCLMIGWGVPFPLLIIMILVMAVAPVELYLLQNRAMV